MVSDKVDLSTEPIVKYWFDIYALATEIFHTNREATRSLIEVKNNLVRKGDNFTYKGKTIEDWFKDNQAKGEKQVGKNPQALQEAAQKLGVNSGVDLGDKDKLKAVEHIFGAAPGNLAEVIKQRLAQDKDAQDKAAAYTSKGKDVPPEVRKLTADVDVRHFVVQERSSSLLETQQKDSAAIQKIVTVLYRTLELLKIEDTNNIPVKEFREIVLNEVGSDISNWLAADKVETPAKTFEHQKSRLLMIQMLLKPHSRSSSLLLVF